MAAAVILPAGAAELYRGVSGVDAEEPEATDDQRHLAEPEMVFVEGGTFRMGSTGEGADIDEAPIHQVTLSDFYIGKYEVTQAQWRAIMGTTVAQQRDKANPSWKLYGVGDNYPMYYVRWTEAQEFVTRLNTATGKKYALPTEAQWEFAARGGNKNRGYTYAGSNSLDGVAWYSSNSGSTTHTVGTKLPNELGIYDMSGNVWEWCGDWYGIYSAAQQTDPTGPSAGLYRVCRGGDWRNNAHYCRSAFRYYDHPGYFSNNLGFRLVLIP